MTEPATRGCRVPAPVVIVGAGPAGLAAAEVIDGYGLPVLLVDEQPRPGGQIFRQPPVAFAGVAATYTAGYSWGAGLVAMVQQRGIAFAHSTTALGLLHDRGDSIDSPALAAVGGSVPPDRLSLVLRGPAGVRTVPASAVLVATGGYDLPVPLPGWTLPGVVMAGAAQGLVKSQKMVPPGPIVLAGGHPLLIVVAAQLLAAGANVSEIVLDRGLPGPVGALRSLPAVPGHVAMLTELAGAIGRLVRAGVRISTRSAVTAARGAQRVRTVEIARLDRSGRPSGPVRTAEAATLVLGYGFAPSTELARQAQCALRWERSAGGWVVEHDGAQRSSVPGVYVAGEPTGIAGAEQSRAEGVLAGLSVVTDLHGPVLRATWRRARAQLRRAQRFSAVVRRLFEPQPELLAALATPETVLCRCELVTAADLDRTLAKNPQMSTVNAVKLESRAGMGPCQGRYCEASVARVVGATRGLCTERVGHTAAHLPIKPVLLGELAELSEQAAHPQEERTASRAAEPPDLTASAG